MAIDYGRKRTGLAVSDPLRITANGLATVRTHELFDFLDDYLEKETVDCFVVGDPVNTRPSQMRGELDAFVEKLQKRYPAKEVKFEDERFTSGMAKKAMLEGGLGRKARQNKETVDKISAVIILQSYMEQCNKM